MTSSGFITPIELMPTDALAVPYALPTHVSAIENIEPIDPKNVEYIGHSSVGVKLAASCRRYERKYISLSKEQKGRKNANKKRWEDWNSQSVSRLFFFFVL